MGHLNIGAGRIVYQDLVKINRACADGSILQNKEIVSAFSYAKENGKNIHFMGLTSNGGVHSSFDHLFKLCEIFGTDPNTLIGWYDEFPKEEREEICEDEHKPSFVTLKVNTDGSVELVD